MGGSYGGRDGMGLRKKITDGEGVIGQALKIVFPFYFYCSKALFPWIS